MSKADLFGVSAPVAGFAVWHPWKRRGPSIGRLGFAGDFWLGLGSGVDTLLTVSWSWDRALTWRVIRTKLNRGL